MSVLVFCVGVLCFAVGRSVITELSCRAVGTLCPLGCVLWTHLEMGRGSSAPGLILSYG